MWRKFRYYLRLKFPDLNIQVERVNSFNYRVTIPDLQISVPFGYSNSLKEEEGDTTLKLMVESLTTNLKSQIFQRRKFKNNNI
jgi:hypothetical protein